MRLFSVLLFVSLSLSTQAWDADGHRLVAHIAQSQMTPATHKAVNKLLGDMNLATASTWMDREKKNLGEDKAKWHYDNRPVCDEKTPLKSYCRDDHCLSVQLAVHLDQLANASLSKHERRQALLIVTHLIGDLHQPFHTGDHDDRGGNQLDVVFDDGRRKTVENLHRYWDSVALDRAMQGERSDAYSKRLIKKYAAHYAEWTSGDAAQWQNDAYRLAQQIGYGQLEGFSCKTTRDGQAFILSDEYHHHAAKTAEQQLVKAGFRLAKMLNAAFDHTP